MLIGERDRFKGMGDSMLISNAKTLSLSTSVLVGISLLGSMAGTGLAQSIPEEAEVAAAGQVDDTVPALTTESETGLTTYEQLDSFSIQYPQDWQVNLLGEDSIEIVNTGANPRLNIHTTVRLLRENPDAVVNRSIDQFVSDEVRVKGYRIVTVDDQSAFRIWMGDYMSENMAATGDAIQQADTDAVATFIGYGDDQTALLVSHYAADHPDAETQILQIHDSFTNTGIVTAVGE